MAVNGFKWAVDKHHEVANSSTTMCFPTYTKYFYYSSPQICEIIVTHCF